MIAFHVHGHEADIDAFFDDLEKTVEAKATEAEKLWPSLEFMEPDVDLGEADDDV